MEELREGLFGPVVYVPQGDPLRLVVREGVLYYCPSKFLQVVALQNSVIVGLLAQISGKLSFSLPSASEAMMLVSESFSIVNSWFFHFL